MVHGVDYSTIRVYDNQGNVRTIQMPTAQIKKNVDGGFMTQDKAGVYTIKGAEIERQDGNQQKGKVVGEPKVSGSISFNALADSMNLPADIRQAFMNFLNEEGLNIDETGDINFGDVNKLQEALNKYAEANKKSFVDPANGKFVKFTENSDPNGINELTTGDNPILGSQDGNGRYKLNNEEAFNEKLPEQIGEPTYEIATAKPTSFEGAQTTRTTRRENTVEIPNDLKHNKDAKEQFTTQVNNAYTEYVNRPDIQVKKNVYIALNKYEKQVEKEMAKIQKEWLSDPNNVSARNKKQMNGVDIIKMFVDKNMSAQEKAGFNKNVNDLLSDESKQDFLLQAYRDLGGYAGNRKWSDLTDIEKRNAAVYAVAKERGLDPEVLLQTMAIDRVMANRTPEQIKADDKYFIEHQTEDYVNDAEAEQVFNNTDMHLSKKSAKAHNGDGREHQYVGKYGLRMIETCPQLFGDEVSQNEFNANKDGDYFEADVKDPETGRMVHKYFKFNSENYKRIMLIACDPTNVSEEDKDFIKSHNMTLREGREGLMLVMPTRTGDMARVEEIIGNGNKKVGERELQRWRHMGQRTGLSADANHTKIKRLLNVLKEAGIGFGIGALTGGLGALLSGPVKAVAETASQTLKWSTEGRYIDYTTPERTIHGITPETIKTIATDDQSIMHTVTLDVNGRSIEYDVTTFVPGQEYTINIEGQEYTVTIPEETGQVWADGESGEILVDGQRATCTKNIVTKQALNAGIAGGIAGAAHALFTSGNIHDKGRNNDNVFDFTQIVENTETDTICNYTLFSIIFEVFFIKKARFRLIPIQTE